ncbi:unnamed protein product [Cylicocyclus nassatus]|uniref:Uncharacterized protein n=1 Tax=Cylicocyclus nassatus TaxID=53992 RepID=A0AA36GWH9_CYLNA|nr:unnamed protein product [Cylicocyclus nassatus]
MIGRISQLSNLSCGPPVHQRTDTALYTCRRCRRQNKKYTSVAVNNDLFEQDPCLLSHNCIPMDRNKDKANRVAYESCQKIKRGPQKQRISPGVQFNETAFSILKTSWKSLEARKKFLANFVRTGYASRRCSFTRGSELRFLAIFGLFRTIARSRRTDGDFLEP